MSEDTTDPTLTTEGLNYFLEGLFRCGLTMADCREFFATKRTAKELYYVKLAEELYHEEGEVEIDGDAIVSLTQEYEEPKGAYVMAWVWVPKDE